MREKLTCTEGRKTGGTITCYLVAYGRTRNVTDTYETNNYAKALAEWEKVKDFPYARFLECIERRNPGRRRQS